jgi:hypothetical protein
LSPKAVAQAAITFRIFVARTIAFGDKSPPTGREIPCRPDAAPNIDPSCRCLGCVTAASGNLLPERIRLGITVAAPADEDDFQVI